MHEIDFFGNVLKLRNQHCIKNGSNKAYKVEEPYVNIYVRLRNKCNANCEFCEFRGDTESFNINKFETLISEMKNKVKINKISFTGGEPTLNLNLLETVLKVTNEIDPNIFTVINTNGINLMKLIKVSKYLDSIALSRHHYIDEINNKILGFKAPSREDIKRFQEKISNKNLLHLSCNLIKDLIDKEEEILNYMEVASEMGVLDVGLVSLMRVNDFCKDNQVLFDSIEFKSDRILKNKEWKHKEFCRCANYLYMPKNEQNLVKFYGRYYCQTQNVESQLVFDGEHLKDGFNGKIIY